MKFTDFFLALSVVAIWGANAAIGKLGVPQIPVFAFLTLRFALTALLCMPFVQWSKTNAIACLRIALLLNVLHYGFIFSAMPHLDASALALIQQTQVPIAVLIAALVFHEKLEFKVWLGILCGFAGVALIKTVDRVTTAGFTLALLGGVAWAFANAEMKRHDNLPLPTFMGLTTLFSVPFLAFASCLYDQDLSDKWPLVNWHQAGFALVYQIVLGGFAMMVWQKLLVRYPVKKIVPMTLLQPVFGILAGMIIFYETISLKMMVGGVLTLIGVAVIIFNRKPKPVVD